ncbi:MAG: hypothetical protein M9964_12055 [Solirubrobacterales bacterium]|nr:hypothetical protein [Solirubrobacterales bacterium]
MARVADGGGLGAPTASEQQRRSGCRRTVEELSAPRAISALQGCGQKLCRDAEGDRLLELVAPCAEDLKAALARQAPQLPEKPRLADASRSLEQKYAAAARGRLLEGPLDRGDLPATLQQLAP